jgi:hypothetical protein
MLFLKPEVLVDGAEVLGRSLSRLDADDFSSTTGTDNLRAAAVEVGKALVDWNLLWIGTPFFPIPPTTARIGPLGSLVSSAQLSHVVQ